MNRFLPDHAKNIVSKYSQFENQFIGIELAGRKTFYAHIGFDFTVELLTFTVSVVKGNNIFITVAEIRPEHINLNIRHDTDIVSGIISGIQPEKKRSICYLSAKLNRLAQDAYDDACRPGNPRDTTVEELKELYRKIMA